MARSRTESVQCAARSTGRAESAEAVGATALSRDGAGDRVVLGDGAISFAVVEVSPHLVHCTVLTGGRVQGRPGVHLPSERLRVSTPTDDDLRLGRAMAEAGADFLAVSFVRSAHDLRVMREAIHPFDTRLVAKIETMSAVSDLDDIIAESDAVMVARGDLGIECPLEDVPHLQKRIVRACVEAAVPDLLTGQTQLMFVTIPDVISHIQAGSLRPIGITSKERSRSLPDVVPMAEQGWPDFDVRGWFGVVAPAGTPKAIVDKYNATIKAMLAREDTQARLLTMGLDALTSTPEEFAAVIKSEVAKWAPVVKASGAKVE